MSVRALLAPLLIVAVVAATLGFVVQRGLTTPRERERIGISVIALPSAPDPTPEPTPKETPRSSIRVNGRSSGGTSVGGPSDDDTSEGGTDNCPAGCRCETRPPAGVVIVCR